MTATSTFTVREMAGDQGDTVKALLIEAFLPYEPHFPPGLFGPYLENLLDLDDGRPTILVAESRGEMVGTMRFYPANAQHGVPLPDGWAMARAAAVRPNLRRTGVAMALLAECERRALPATHLAFHTIDQMSDTFAFALGAGYPRRPDLDFDGGRYLDRAPGEIMIRAFGKRLAAAQ